MSNYSLEKESHFDENAAGIITNFLKHMQQPVCLVAHNGDTFDFPIVKQTFKKLNLVWKTLSFFFSFLYIIFFSVESAVRNPMYRLLACISRFGSTIATPIFTYRHI